MARLGCLEIRKTVEWRNSCIAGFLTKGGGPDHPANLFDSTKVAYADFQPRDFSSFRSAFRDGRLVAIAIVALRRMVKWKWDMIPVVIGGGVIRFVWCLR